MKTLVVEGLSAKLGGGQTYLRNLLEHYRGHEGVRVIALLPPEVAGMLPRDGSVELQSPAFPSRGPFQRALWIRTHLPRWLREVKADVLFCPGGYLSARGRGFKTAVTFQNMLPFSIRERQRYPLGYSRVRYWLLEKMQRASLRHADLAICISQYARQVVDEQVPRRRGRTVVIPHGIDSHFAQGARAARPAGFEYVLYVSVLNYYKAQLEVLEAWAELKRQRPTAEKLVLAGFDRWPYARRVRERIAQLKLQDDVVVAGEIPYLKLPAWYAHAKVNLFASSCENCPFILLEAMGSGQPMLSSNYPPMPELAGSGADYFDPYNPAGLAGLLRRYLDDAPLRAELGARSAEQSRKYTWERAATATWEQLIAL